MRAYSDCTKQRLNVPLETLADTFHADPSWQNAKRYRAVALENWEDEIISDADLLVILHEIRNT